MPHRADVREGHEGSIQIGRTEPVIEPLPDYFARMSKRMFWNFIEGVENKTEFIVDISESVSQRADQFFVNSPRLAAKGAGLLWNITGGLIGIGIGFAVGQSVDAVQWGTGKTIGAVASGFAAVWSVPGRIGGGVRGLFNPPSVTVGPTEQRVIEVLDVAFDRRGRDPPTAKQPSSIANITFVGALPVIEYV